MEMNVKELYTEEVKEYFNIEKFRLGPWTSWSVMHDPKHLIFVLSRYKFVSKILEGKEYVLEVGCGDAFGIPIVANTGRGIKKLYAIDWEQRFIEDNLQRLAFAENINFIQHDINEYPFEKHKVTAIYNIDFIEHLDPAKEDIVMKNMIAAYEKKENAIMIIGTPNLTAAQYASSQSAALHINLKDHDSLKQLLDKYFYNVLMFGMNDEVVHTGYAPMCHYLWGIGIGLR